MNQSDRLFLEEACPALHQRLTQKLVEDPNVQLAEQDFQDFEVHYSIACSGTVLTLQVQYSFLGEVLQHGLRELLQRVWAELPLQWRADAQQASLQVELDAAGFHGEAPEEHSSASWLCAYEDWRHAGSWPRPIACL
mmetsp:Transcript_96339/g.223388  ORF Transcript_96339/g.223388 Transcript_96339/m.223388 type:complete len:137 (+) Transcript_96339:63-473(+)